MIVSILEGRSLPVYGDGRNVRDWLHVADHCRAIDLILASGRSGEVYNIGGRSECENIRLVNELCALADAAFAADAALRARHPRCPSSAGPAAAGLISFVKDRPGHDRRYAIDGRKIERELGFKPSLTLETGLASTFAWYLENESWWRAALGGAARGLQ
jgi:dTDP-glucose 4,6-dehydratase